LKAPPITNAMAAPLAPFVDALPVPSRLIAVEHDGRLTVGIRAGTHRFHPTQLLDRSATDSRSAAITSRAPSERSSGVGTRVTLRRQPDATSPPGGQPPPPLLKAEGGIRPRRRPSVHPG